MLSKQKGIMIEMLITVVDYKYVLDQGFQSSGPLLSKHKGRLEREGDRKATTREDRKASTRGELLETRSRKWEARQSVCNWQPSPSIPLYSGERLNTGIVSQTHKVENILLDASLQYKYKPISMSMLVACITL